MSQNEILQLPIDRLVITKTNARKDHKVDPSLLASIAGVGLLYPLTVDALEDGTYDVVDGAQRLVAIRAGIENGSISAEAFEKIPALVRPNGMLSDVDGLEISLHANLRTPMHPLDECEAITELSKRGEDEQKIAQRFGKDVRWIEQRVKLASLIPDVKQAFREGKIGLHAATLFALGSDEQQAAFVKRNKSWDFSINQLNFAMTEKKISAAHANFELALYPEAKIQRDLFAKPGEPEGIWLLDKKLFFELQDIWVQGEVQRLKDLGYGDVICLEQGDWQTVNQHVKLEGKARPKNAEQRAACVCFLQMDQFGKIKVHMDMVRRVSTPKSEVKKGKDGKPDTTEAEAKPMRASQFTTKQQEIVNALAATGLFNVIAGGKADEKLVQWMVVSTQFFRNPWVGSPPSSRAFMHNGTRSRWEKLRSDYPNENLVGDDKEFDKGLQKDLSYEDWCGLKPTERKRLYNHAVASMVHVPHGGHALKVRAELDDLDWLVPGRDFFSRYRTDQLIDYRKRSGDKEAGSVAKKKEDHIKDALVISGEKHAYKLGLIK